MSGEKVVGAIIALLVLALVLYVLGGIAVAILATRLSARGGRRLGASTQPTLSGRWSGKLGDLRDGLAAELRLRRLATNQGVVGAAASNFQRAAVAIHVSRAEGATASYLAILFRPAKNQFGLELRSGHPFRRPAPALSREVMDHLQTVLRETAGVTDIARN
jgi:hypothetical protein